MAIWSPLWTSSTDLAKSDLTCHPFKTCSWTRWKFPPEYLKAKSNQPPAVVAISRFNGRLISWLLYPAPIRPNQGQIWPYTPTLSVIWISPNPLDQWSPRILLITHRFWAKLAFNIWPSGHLIWLCPSWMHHFRMFVKKRYIQFILFSDNKSNVVPFCYLWCTLAQISWMRTFIHLNADTIQIQFHLQIQFKSSSNLRKHSNVIPVSYLCCRLAQILACKTLSQQWNSSPPENWVFYKFVYFFIIDKSCFITLCIFLRYKAPQLNC